MVQFNQWWYMVERWWSDDEWWWTRDRFHNKPPPFIQWTQVFKCATPKPGSGKVKKRAVPMDPNHSKAHSHGLPIAGRLNHSCQFLQLELCLVLRPTTLQLTQPGGDILTPVQVNHFANPGVESSCFPRLSSGLQYQRPLKPQEERSRKWVQGSADEYT